MQAKIPDNICVRSMLLTSKSNGLFKTLPLQQQRRRHLQIFAVGIFADCEDCKAINNYKDMHKGT